MSIIFDGNFKTTDKWTSERGTYGAWSSSCLDSANTLVIVPAPGRAGEYAGLWTLTPGRECGSVGHDLHAMLYKDNKITTGEYWYGYSMRLDNSYPWTGQSWLKFGMSSPSQDQYAAPCSSTNAELAFSFNNELSTNYILRLNGKCGSNVGYYSLLSSYQTNVWHDWMVHVKWARDTSGFVEIWHRIEGQSYTKIFSKTNIQTKKETPGSMLTSFGAYRGYLATKTQKLYGMGFKIGTTRDDVEYTTEINQVPVCGFTVKQ